MPRMAWKPPSVGSANGSRKEVSRSIRSGENVTTAASTVAPPATTKPKHRTGMPPAQSRPTSTSPRRGHRPEVRLGDQQQRRARRRPAAPGSAATRWSGSARAAPGCARPRGRRRAWPARRAAGARSPRSNHWRAPLSLTPMISTSSSRKATPIRAIGDQRRRNPAGSRSATAIAPRPRQAQITCWTPGFQAGSSASAASMEDAEKTMTRPMTSSSPPAPSTRWQLVIGPSSHAGPWNRLGGRS